MTNAALSTKGGQQFSRLENFDTNENIERKKQ